MLAYLFVILAVVFRFLPHTWHFTPLGAALLFFGARQPRKRMWIPLVLFTATDIILTKYVNGYPLSVLNFASTGFYAVAILIGGFLKPKSEDDESKLQLPKVMGGSLAASLSFFVISNLAVWYGWNMYPHTLDGLKQCYVAALPFFQGTLIGDQVFGIAFFSLPFMLHLAHGADMETGSRA